MPSLSPRIVVVAGPSGSGKSSLFAVSDFETACFNVDDRCADLNRGSYQQIPPEVRTQAQKECRDFIETCTREQRSFAVETTLRTDIAIQQARRAKAAGYRIEMIFVGTDSVEINIRRVTRRVLDGGHGASESRIREIYQRSLENLPATILAFDEVVIYDSSASEQLPRLVARFVNGKAVEPNTPLPRWCASALAGLTRR